MTRRERYEGLLLGTALGDALGLPAEGLAAATIRRRFGALGRCPLRGRTGFVSDDTEQSALLAQALVGQGSPAGISNEFGRSLVSWFARLPFGIGLATLRACLKRLCGLRPSGVWSAGNGAAMRAAIVGAVFADDPERRRAVGRAVAEVTHRHPAGIEGALYVAEVAAALASGSRDIEAACGAAAAIVSDPGLAKALEAARGLALVTSPEDAAAALGNSGWIEHTAALATFALRRHADDSMATIRFTIHAGGDTDTIAAIVGALTGLRNGPGSLDRSLIDLLHDGPFGPAHLRALAAALDSGATPPRWSWIGALARNLALYPVVIAHGFGRLWPA